MTLRRVVKELRTDVRLKDNLGKAQVSFFRNAQGHKSIKFSKIPLTSGERIQDVGYYVRQYLDGRFGRGSFSADGYEEKDGAYVYVHYEPAEARENMALARERLAVLSPIDASAKLRTAVAKAVGLFKKRPK